ncbi:hypothetical protein [Methanocella sp. MCL-LM]|uniref:hypothetical protein n=1 Tax=Methanocella sp. MCL-LM TaxID=3412035 RepID=UPI003C784E64
MKKKVALICLVCLALAIPIAGYAEQGFEKKEGMPASPTTAQPPITTMPKATVTPTAAAPIVTTPVATAIANPTVEPPARATPFPGTVTVNEADPEAARYQGTWDTPYGLLTLTASGKHVHGEYAYANGTMEMALSADGKSMVGKWYEEPTRLPPRDSGKIAFTLSDDGNILHGKWWYGENEYGDIWDGARVNDASAS